MKLHPFLSVDDTPFSATWEEVQHARGKPIRTCRNAVGLNELDYDDVVFRFQDNGRLEEVTRQARTVEFGTLVVPFGALESFVRAHDPLAFERAGFLVSPKYGLAFDPRSPAWVTALAAHCIDTWRAL